MIQINQEMYNKMIADYKHLEEENDRLKSRIQQLENDKFYMQAEHEKKITTLYMQLAREVK